MDNNVKHFQELRSGGRGVGLNNGLVLLFECSEDFGLVRGLLSSHSADIWVETVRGVGCIDHYTRQAEIPTTFTPPYYKVCVGGDSKWLTTLNTSNTVTGDQRQVKVEAETRAEMVYNILCDVSGCEPSYDNFIRWYCYPSQSITMTTLAGQLELQRQLLPLQNHVDRQLFNARVQCVLEVFCSINHTDDDHVHRVDDSIYDSSSHYLVRNVCNFYLSFQRIPTLNCWTKHETVEFHSFLNLGTSGKIKLDSRHLSEIELKIKHHCNSIRQTFILTIVVISCVHQILVWSEANVVLTYFRAYLLREVSWRS